MYDLALDFRTKDLVVAMNKDVAGRSGNDVFYQRIHIRLIVAIDSWLLHPEFGSRLTSLLRVSEDAALASVQAAVIDALADMDDIDVGEVVALRSTTDSRKIEVHIRFTPIPTPNVGLPRNDLVTSIVLPSPVF